MNWDDFDYFKSAIIGGALIAALMVLAMPVWAGDKPPEPKVRINCGGLPMNKCFQEIEEFKWKLIKAKEWGKRPDGEGCASKDMADEFHMDVCNTKPDDR